MSQTDSPTRPRLSNLAARSVRGPRAWDRFFPWGYDCAQPGIGPLTYDQLAVVIGLALDQIVPAQSRVALGLVKRKFWTQRGHARVDDYAKVEFAQSGRTLRDLAALGGGFDRFPRLLDAFCGHDGGKPLGQVAALQITRVANDESLATWIEQARQTDIRTFKKEVSRARQARSAFPVSDDPDPVHQSGAQGHGQAVQADEAVQATQEVQASEPMQAIDERPSLTDALIVEDSDTEERLVVRMWVPQPLKIAFAEALALYRAVIGHEGGVVGFIDALVGEAAASGLVDESCLGPVSPRRNPARREADLHQQTNDWEQLGQPREEVIDLACKTLGEVGPLLQRAGVGNAEELEDQMRALSRLDRQLRARLGKILMMISLERGWNKLEFNGAGHYVEQRLGLHRNTAGGLSRLARLLWDLPLLRRVYERGMLSFEQTQLVLRALDLGRIDAELQRVWIRHATQVTIKRLRAEVRVLERRRQELPADADPGQPWPLADPDWLRSIEQRPGQLRERVKRLGQRATEDDRDGPLLALTLPAGLARLFASAVEGTRQALEQAAGEAPDEADTRADARADDEAGVSDEGAGAARMFSNAAAGAEAEQVGDPSLALRTARMFSRKDRRLPWWVALLAMVEDFVDTWDDPQGIPKRHGDAVYSREGWGCAAPGCTSRKQLEDHHGVYLSQGGPKKPLCNRWCACRFHHGEGEHGEFASCKGEAPDGIIWRLGRRGLGRYYLNERRLDPEEGKRRIREAELRMKELLLTG